MGSDLDNRLTAHSAVINKNDVNIMVSLDTGKSGGGSVKRGGSQRGGRSDKIFKILETSKLYNDIIASLVPIHEIPNINQILREEIEAGRVIEVSPESSVIQELNEPKTDLSLAEDAAKNLQIIANMIKQIDDENGSLLTEYTTLVKMCSQATALEVIKGWMKTKLNVATPTVNDTTLLNMFGWNNGVNLLLYNEDKPSRGIFSKFCVDIKTQTVSRFFKQKCGLKNYICMLDWLILVALHLQYLGINKVVKTLIHNIHYVLFGFLNDVATDFTVSDESYYSSRVKKLLDGSIFYNPSLLSVIPEITKFFIENSSENESLSALYPKIRRTTVKLGGTYRKRDNLTRNRKHQDKLRDFSHTIKVERKSSLNTKKTRRNLSVKT